MLGGVDGADVGVLVERVAQAQGLEPALQGLDQPLGDGLLDKQAGAGATDVALVEEDAVDDALDRLGEGGVVEDDIGRFAPELQRQAFACAGQSCAGSACPPRWNR